MTALPGPSLHATDSRAADDLDFARRRRRSITWVVGSLVLAALIVTAGVSLGPVEISPGTVWNVIGHHTIGLPEARTWTIAEDNITWLVRTPRVLLGVVVGAGLAMSGAVIQALVRNVLADPYLLGVTSGASFGAALTLLFGVGATLGSGALSISAFVGGLVATVLVFSLARIGGPLTAIRLILAGVAIGYALSAATSFLIFASDTREGARAVLFWLLGGLDQSRWSSVAVPSITVFLSLAALVGVARPLDALAVGDDTARALGVHPTRFRATALAVVALCVGVVVAVAGSVGFVGLVVPHIVRRFIGGEHRRLLPVSALAGAAFVVAADIVARTAFRPRELPLGIVTALVGAPFIVFLLKRTSPGAGSH